MGIAYLIELLKDPCPNRHEHVSLTTLPYLSKRQLHPSSCSSQNVELTIWLISFSSIINFLTDLVSSVLKIDLGSYTTHYHHYNDHSPSLHLANFSSLLNGLLLPPMFYHTKSNQSQSFDGDISHILLSFCSKPFNRLLNNGAVTTVYLYAKKWILIHISYHIQKIALKWIIEQNVKLKMITFLEENIGQNISYFAFAKYFLDMAQKHNS